MQDTAELRFERDVNRMVFNDNLDLLGELTAQAGIESDSVSKLLEAPSTGPLIRRTSSISIADHRLWYKQGDSVLFSHRWRRRVGKN